MSAPQRKYLSLVKPVDESGQVRRRTKVLAPPKSVKSRRPSTDEVATVEAARNALAEQLTSLLRVEFRSQHPRDAWMVDAINMPLGDPGPNRLADMQRAVERLRQFVQVATQSGEERTDPSEPFAGEPADHSERLARRQAATESLTKANSWVPEILKETLSPDSSGEEIRRYDLITRVSELLLWQIDLGYPDMDISPLRGLPELDWAMVITDLWWLFRLHDDLDRLEREIKVAEAGLELLSAAV